jgi:hypothetical protein
MIPHTVCLNKWNYQALEEELRVAGTVVTTGRSKSLCAPDDYSKKKKKNAKIF